MTIGGVSSISPLINQLQSQGLSKDKLKRVADDVASATSQSGGSAAPITPAVRSAIDTKIAADVLSGTLSKSDAAAVKTALDTVESQDGTTAAATASGAAATTGAPAQAGGAQGGGGGGGGGGASEKTVLSESVIVAGSTKTTTISYTDNSTSTATTTASDSDIARYGKPVTADASNAAKEYSPSIEPGILVDQLA